MHGRCTHDAQTVCGRCTHGARTMNGRCAHDVRTKKVLAFTFHGVYRHERKLTYGRVDYWRFYWKLGESVSEIVMFCIVLPELEQPV